MTDLGTGIPLGKSVEAVQNGAELIGISALLMATMAHIPRVIEALDAASLRGKTKVIVGGAPVTQAFADQIGADGYAPDASQAVTVVRTLLGVG